MYRYVRHHDTRDCAKEKKSDTNTTSTHSIPPHISFSEQAGEKQNPPPPPFTFNVTDSPPTQSLSRDTTRHDTTPHHTRREDTRRYHATPETTPPQPHVLNSKRERERERERGGGGEGESSLLPAKRCSLILFCYCYCGRKRGLYTRFSFALSALLSALPSTLFSQSQSQSQSQPQFHPRFKTQPNLLSHLSVPSPQTRIRTPKRTSRGGAGFISTLHY